VAKTIVEVDSPEGGKVYFAVSEEFLIDDQQDLFLESADVKSRFDDLAKYVTGRAEQFHRELQAAKPKTIELSVGLTVGGKLGIPVVAQGSAEANMTLTVSWGS
jgi:hypothetical protein